MGAVDGLVDHPHQGQHVKDVVDSFENLECQLSGELFVALFVKGVLNLLFPGLQRKGEKLLNELIKNK